MDTQPQAPTPAQEEVMNLMPEHTLQAKLKPTSPVTCRNRGPRELVDKHDAHEYRIPPFALFTVTYAAALHLQRRQIVPGTRNPSLSDPTLPQFLSWIGIKESDGEAALEPFDEAFLARVGEAKEGLNRAAMPMAADREVEVLGTNDLRRGLPGAGVAPSAQAMSVGRSRPSLEGGSEEARAAAAAPVKGSDAVQASASAIASGWVPPADETQLRVKSAPAPTDGAPKKNRKG